MNLLHYLDAYPLVTAVVIGVGAFCAERLFLVVREKVSKNKNDTDGAGGDHDVAVGAGKVSRDGDDDQRDAGFGQG